LCYHLGNREVDKKFHKKHFQAEVEEKLARKQKKQRLNEIQEEESFDCEEDEELYFQVKHLLK